MKKYMFFFILCALLHCSLFADWVFDGESYTMSIGTREYEYNPRKALDLQTLSASCTMQDSATGVSWGFSGEFSFDNGPLGFFYAIDDIVWSYDIPSRQWITQGSENRWEYNGGGAYSVWTSVQDQSVWVKTFDLFTSELQWHQFIVPENSTLPRLTRDTLGNYYNSLSPPLKQVWKYSSMNGAFVFVNDTLNISWSYLWDRTSKKMIMSRINSPSNPETWAYDPLINSYTLTSPNIGRNDWRVVQTDNGYLKWIEAQSKEAWMYIPSDGGGNTGMWKSKKTGEKYYYFGQPKAWLNTSGNMKHFPPCAPHLLAYQTMSMSFAAPPATLQESPYNPNSPWLLDHGNTVTLFPHALTLANGLRIGNNTSAGFGTDGWMYSYQDTKGERWKTIWASYPTLARNENNSDDIIFKDNIMRTSLDEWYREDCSAFSWVFFVAQNKWNNKTLNMTFEYDYATQTWSDVGVTNQWKYLKNTDNRWVWKNLTTNEEWYYTKPDTTHIWRNMTTGELWTPVGSHFQNIGDQTEWYYNATTHLWYTPGNATGKNLFPLLPGNFAGHSGACRYLSLFSEYLGRAFTSPSEPKSLSTHMNEQAARISTMQASVVPSDPTLRGMAKRTVCVDLYERLMPFVNSVNTGLKGIYENTYAIHNSASLSLAPSSEVSTFQQWTPTSMFLAEPGKGSATFAVNNKNNKFKLGLSDVIPENGIPLYTIEIGPNPSAPSIKEIAIYHYNSTTATNDLLYSGILPSYPVVDPALGVSGDYIAFWFTLKNGRFILGKESPLILESSPSWKILLDYTFPHPESANLAFFSLTQYAGQANSFRNIISYPYDLINNSSAMQECQTSLVATIMLAKFEEIWIRAKTKLIALSQSKPTTQAKIASTYSVLEIIRGNGRTQSALAAVTGVNVTKNLRDASLLGGYPVHPPSYEYLNFIYTSLSNTDTILNTYLDYTNSLEDLEEAFEAIIAANPAMLSHQERLSLIDATKQSINQFITTLSTGINQTITLAQQQAALQGNSDITPFTAFFQEELAILEELSAALSLVDPIALSRFSYQDTLYTADPVSAQLSLAPQDREEEQARLTTLDLLSTHLSQGECSLFAALTAGAIILCINNKFDDIRGYLETYLSTHGYTQFHLPPATNSPLRIKATALSTLKTILNEITPALTLAGTALSKTFSGAAKPTTSASAIAFIDQNITAASNTSLSDQQPTAGAGSADYLANTSIKTAANETNINTIREILSTQENKQDAYSRIYVKDAIIALGNGNFNSDSGNALSVLGAAEISPEGNALITLNSDLTISGANFLRPSSDFGTDPTDPSRCIPSTPEAERGVHEIVFYSAVERTITVTSFTDLDLTGFAQGLTENGQRIVFAGKVKLVFEPNTRLRLPYTSPNQPTRSLTVAFRDDAELIFKGIENYDVSSFTQALSGPDAVRSKILGCGTLEFSHNAKAHIYKSALVSVEADYTSNVSNIAIVLKDNSQWLIGNAATRGGGFQIGNIRNGGSNNLDNDNYPNNNSHPLFGDQESPFVPHPTSIDFSLTIQGAGALFYIGAQGFFGTGVGTIHKGGVINGTTSQSPWTVHSLYNVNNIQFNFLDGTFWHQSCENGDSENGSLLALGELSTRALYKLTLNKGSSALIRGGGRVLFLRGGVTTPRTLSVLNTVEPLNGTAADNGKYSILAPSPVIMLRQVTDSIHPGVKKYGRGAISETTSLYQLSAPLDEFYLALTFQQLAYNGKYVISYQTEKENDIIFVDNSGQIVTRLVSKRVVKDQARKKITAENLSEKGVLRALSLNANARNFVRPRS